MNSKNVLYEEDDGGQKVEKYLWQIISDNEWHKWIWQLIIICGMLKNCLLMQMWIWWMHNDRLLLHSNYFPVLICLEKAFKILFTFNDQEIDVSHRTWNVS